MSTDWRNAAGTLPPSATHAAVAWIGVATMVAAVAVLNVWPPFQHIAYLALIVMGCSALGIFVPDLLWQKVQRRALSAAPAAGNWPRVGTKFVGLAGSLGFVALLYWAFPEYRQGSQFYGNYYAALKVLLPAWAVNPLARSLPWAEVCGSSAACCSGNGANSNCG